MKTILLVLGVLLLGFLIFANIRFEIQKTDTFLDKTKFSENKRADFTENEHLLINLK
tara:strand:+ start:431 stop:601 length:171 start_codon:yes stop_codon:yes gene_type:complete